MLLGHASESLAAVGEGIEAGRVGLDPAAERLGSKVGGRGECVLGMQVKDHSAGN